MHCPRMEMVYRETQVMPRNAFVFGATNNVKKAHPMKPFARMTCQAVALRRLILVSSIALATGNGRVATKNTKEGGLA